MSEPTADASGETAQQQLPTDEEQQQPQQEQQQQEPAAETNGGGGAEATAEAVDNADKCPQCELPNDPEGCYRSHLRRLLTESVAGSLDEFDAIKKHWQNFGASLPGFIATPYCAHCRLHFQGFLRYTAHCREAVAAAAAAAAADSTSSEAVDDADAAAATAAAAAASAVEHERRFEELVTFVENFTNEAVTADDQKALAAGFLCPAGGAPNYDMFQLKADFVFATSKDQQQHQQQATGTATGNDKDDSTTDAAATTSASSESGTTTPHHHHQQQQQQDAPPVLACLVCQQPFRCLHGHLEDALWGASTPIFRGRHSQIADARAAHLRSWLGLDAMHQLQVAFSGGCGGSGGGDEGDSQQQQPAATPHCPACGCHFAQQAGGGGGGHSGIAGRLLMHLQHDMDTGGPGHRQLAEGLRDRLADAVLLTGAGPQAFYDWLAATFACPHGGADPSNGIVEQLRSALDKRRTVSGVGGGAAAAGDDGAGGGNKRPFVGGGGGGGGGRKVARIFRGGGGGGGYGYQHHYGGGRGGGGGWRRY